MKFNKKKLINKINKKDRELNNILKVVIKSCSKLYRICKFQNKNLQTLNKFYKKIKILKIIYNNLNNKNKNKINNFKKK